MSITASLALDSTFLNSVVTSVFAGQNLRLGIILSGSEVAAGSSFATAAAAEYATSWTRPSIVLASNGSYNGTSNQWELPDTTEWDIVAPTGGLSIKQVFVVIGGTTTPGNTTGTFMGIATYSTALAVDAGATQPIKAPWRLYGVS